MKPADVRLVLIHGYNISDGGESTTGRLYEWAEKYGFTDIHEFKYGRFDLIKVAWNSKKVARDLADLIGDKPTVVIAHSHGNVIADLAATEFKAPIIYHIGINAALSVNADFAQQVRKMDNYFTPGDRVVTFSKWWRRLRGPLAWIRPNYWGEAGRKGIKITDENKDQVANFNMQDSPSGLLPIDGHSEFFKYRSLRDWAPELFSMALYKLEKIQPLSEVEQRADLFNLSLKLGEKALAEKYVVTFAEFKNGRQLKYYFRKNGVVVSRPVDLIKYWLEIGGEYDKGYFTV